VKVLISASTVVNNISGKIGNILCYLILFFAVTGVYEVGMRYFWNRPTIWVWELNGLVLSSCIALSGGYALVNRIHVRVDILYNLFSRRTKAIIDICTSAFTLLFLGLLLWQAVKQGLNSLMLSEHTQTIFSPPIYPFKIILAIGIFLFLLQAIADVLSNICIVAGVQKEEF